ncbi:hypothetical protein J7T55_004958 [Diaporthe amygdali]|uniref:uncharacterized protein n=1 Tax=Phomopsis amygdali TaxID=1214568 RepID=UPI0022FE76CD|nr:uncharacterized protein J7T55_004958 [Diaporthe amygdali]KAJ0114714.1 hypothetical protein J7T55_004958 [Diaporthe amygdali]
MAGKKSVKARGETSLNRYRGSGFEDGFADPPVTPEEHATEKQLYDPRIEECIQRYMSRRRLTSDRKALFTKYLALGGVDTDQRQFTGTAKHARDMKEDDEYDADHVREVTANEVLSRGWDEVGKYYNPYYPEHWDVDFAGVVAGYLGDWLPKTMGLWGTEYELAIDTIQNFLRYVQHHDVCPEYAENLAEASKICELARKEIPSIGEIGAAMPGDFNLACQILFCSTGRASSGPSGPVATDDVVYEAKLFDGAEHQNSWDTGIIAPEKFDAERIFKATIAIHEPALIDRMLQRNNPIRVVKTYEDAFVVKEIHPPSEDIISVYNGIKNKDKKTRTIKPIGWVVLTPTIIEDGWDNHPTLATGRPEGNEGDPVSIYLEHTTLSHLKEGMKLRLTICELNIGGGGEGGESGVEFVKACSEILPTFHTFLPQSLMMHYKPHRLNDRLPPSVNDPDAEDRAVLEQVEADAEETEKAERRADPELDRRMKEAEDAEALMKVMERVKVEE